jgi:hypothetical protein
MYWIDVVMCGRLEYQIGNKLEELAFMATGALFRVKILRRNAEHVVTLDANTMKNGLPRRRRFVFRGMGLGLSGFVCHLQILAYGRLPQNPRCAAAGARGIPDKGGTHRNASSRSQGSRRRRIACRLNLC